MEESKLNTCIACKEVIKQGAVVCHHCGRSQTQRYLHILGESLKWTAGVAALLALLISAFELNKIMEHRLRKERAVSEYVNAAKLLAQLGDHLNAQELLLQATEMNPASADVRDLRIKLAQENLRNFALLDSRYMLRFVSKKDSSGLEVFDFNGSRSNRAVFEALKVEELVPLFARGVVDSYGPAKATLLAHLVWMDLLRQSDLEEFDIDNRFREALDIDPDNPYANAMYGAWLLSPRNKTTVTIDQRMKLSRALFSKVLNNNEESRWTKALWINVLAYVDGNAGGHELLRVLQRFRDAGEPIDLKGPAWNALKNLFINSLTYDELQDINDISEEYFQSLLLEFTAEDLLKKLNWLSVLRYGCAPGPGCKTNVHEVQRLLYLSGRLHEANQALDKAAEAYRLALTDGYRESFVDKLVNKHLEQVLSQQGITSRRVLANWDNQSNIWQKKDLILEYHGKIISNADELNKVNSDIGPDQLINIKVLRQGIILELQSKQLSANSLASYVIPESFLLPGNTEKLKHWLFSE